MEVVARRMMKFTADAYKLVTTARKPSDIYRVLSLAKAHPRSQMVLLAMGEIGFPRGSSLRHSAGCIHTRLPLRPKARLPVR